jgi:hypothetical protein
MNDTGIDGYRAYLARRDGEADLLNRRLASREEFFGGLEADPVRSAHPIDRDVFMRNLRRRRPEPGVDRKMLFLLATAKLNQAERFGVGLGETYGLNSGDDLPPRTGVHGARGALSHPPAGLRARHLRPAFPSGCTAIRNAPVRQDRRIPPRESEFHVRGAAEMAGCVMFDELRRVGSELFADEPEVAARIERLYAEILTDEVGHVGYCAARCTPAERAIMRRLYPRIGRLFATQTYEISLLTNREHLHARLDRPL